MGHIYTTNQYAFTNVIKQMKKTNDEDTKTKANTISAHPSKSLTSEILDMYSFTTAQCSPADFPLFLNLENFRERI